MSPVVHPAETTPRKTRIGLMYKKTPYDDLDRDKKKRDKKATLSARDSAVLQKSTILGCGRRHNRSALPFTMMRPSPVDDYQVG